MSEIVKETIRWILFPIAVCCGGEFHAEQGTLTYCLLMWLYGEDCLEAEE